MCIKPLSNTRIAFRLFPASTFSTKPWSSPNDAGIWPFHCHIELHEMSMTMAFRVQGSASEVQKSSKKKKMSPAWYLPKGATSCGKGYSMPPMDHSNTYQVGATPPASTAADPHAGHAGIAPPPAATAAAPHAGHSGMAPPPAATAADPHAGHNMKVLPEVQPPVAKAWSPPPMEDM